MDGALLAVDEPETTAASIGAGHSAAAAKSGAVEVVVEAFEIETFPVDDEAVFFFGGREVWPLELGMACDSV